MLTALIMAGGSGERFWPLSTPERPKQLLSLFSERTMIRETVDRILPIMEPENIFIATNRIQAEAIKTELWDIPEENIIIEPAFKDTAAAIGYGTLIIEERFKEIKELEVVVLASDHLIKDEESFRKALILGGEEAARNSVIVTLGIKPERAETGYGYIEISSSKKEDSSEGYRLNTLYKVKRFREKPNLETAEKYLASCNYLWNSGMFIFRPATIFKNFEILMGEHMEILEELRKIVAAGHTGALLSTLAAPNFHKFEKISIDFGIMEYSKNIKVIPVDIGWSDIGSFSALYEHFTPDENGNVTKGSKILSHDSGANIVIAEDSVVSLLGVENLIVVKNGNNILVADRGRAQDIKKIVTQYNSLA